MSLSTTQYGYIVDPMVPFTDDKGKTIKNGFIRVFMAGTSTPVLTYRNYDGATNQEKIELDNSGRVKHNVIGSKGSLYKVVVYNILHSQENPLLTVDKIAVLGSSINASGATIVTGLDSVTVQEENFLKATVEGTGVELALDPTEVTSEVSTIGAAETAAPDYVVPLLEKTGTEDSKKISLANLFKFSLDWISRLATTITSFASGDFIAVSNTTDGTRKMSKDTLLELTAQNALAGNVAPEFDPTRDEDHKYLAGESVSYKGKTYTFKVDHYGAWSESDVIKTNLAQLLVISNKELEELIGNNLGRNTIIYGSPTSPTSESGHYYNYTTGSVGNSESYYQYALVDVSAARYAKITDFQVGAGSAGIAFYDKDNNFISGVKPSNGNVTVQVPFMAKYMGVSSTENDVTISLSTSVTYTYDRLPNVENFTDYLKPQVVTSIVSAWSANQSITWTSGKFYNKNTGSLGNNSDYYYSNLIDISTYKFMTVTNVTGVSGNAGFAFFDENEDYISGFQPSSGDVEFEIPAGAKYVGLSNKTDSSHYKYPTAINESYDVIPKFKTYAEYVDVNFFRKNSIRMYPAVKTLGAVCFTWDDGYIQYDSIVVDKFNDHNAKCGFAVISRNMAAFGTKNDYIKLQRLGYSLLNHSINGDALTSYATKEDALDAISEAKNYFENNGMLINGWVCPGNQYVANYRDCLGYFHGYAFGDHGTGEGIATQDVNTKSQDILRLRRWQIENATTTLQDVKDIIDECATNGYLLVFYGHAARLTNPDYHDIDWYDDVLNYIQTKYNNGEIFFGSPDECIRYYYDV